MKMMITSIKKRLNFSQLTKHLWVCCGLVMLLLGSGSAWAQTCYTLNSNGSSYSSEVSWELNNSSGDEVASGGGSDIDIETCLPDDCYTLFMHDSWGDGWDSGEWTLSLNGDVVAGPFALADGAAGNVSFPLGNAQCEVIPPPVNDECAGALPMPPFVDGVTSIIGNNTNATSSGVEADCWYGGVENDVWYSFVAPENGNLTIETSMAEGSDFNDTQIQVFDACDGLPLDCDDDGGPSLLSQITLSCGDYLPGATYLIQVDGYGGDIGDFGLSVTADNVDCNNLCESPSLDLAVVNADGGTIEGCLPVEGIFYVNAMLSGGSGNDSYDVSANGGDAVSVSVDGSTVFGPFDAGTSVDVVATGAVDGTCGAEGSIDSPTVCPPDNR